MGRVVRVVIASVFTRLAPKSKLVSPRVVLATKSIATLSIERDSGVCAQAGDNFTF